MNVLDILDEHYSCTGYPGWTLFMYCISWMNTIHVLCILDENYSCTGYPRKILAISIWESYCSLPYIRNVDTVNFLYSQQSFYFICVRNQFVRVNRFNYWFPNYGIGSIYLIKEGGGGGRICPDLSTGTERWNNSIFKVF